MSSKDDLERLDLIKLSVLCGKVAEGGFVDDATALEAQQLKREWLALAHRNPRY